MKIIKFKYTWGSNGIKRDLLGREGRKEERDFFLNWTGKEEEGRKEGRKEKEGKGEKERGRKRDRRDA